MKLIRLVLLSTLITMLLTKCSMDDDVQYNYDHSVLGITSLIINQYSIDLESGGFPVNIGDIKNISMPACFSGMKRTFKLVVNDEFKDNAVIKTTSDFDNVQTALIVNTPQKKYILTVTRKGHEESVVYDITFTK